MDCPFFEYPLLSQEWVKLRTSNFVRTFRIDRNKSPLKLSGKVAVGVLRDSKIFMAPYKTQVTQQYYTNTGPILVQYPTLAQYPPMCARHWANIILACTPNICIILTRPTFKPGLAHWFEKRSFLNVLVQNFRFSYFRPLCAI